MFAILFILGLVLLSPLLGVIVGGIGMFFVAVIQVFGALIAVLITLVNSIIKSLGGGD